MRLHSLEPEATGGPGKGARWIRDANGKPTQADPLRYESAGWLGDDLVGVHPDFVVTESLANALDASGLSGFELRDTVVTKSQEFVAYREDFPDVWKRLVPGFDQDADFAADAGELLLSERALALLNDHRIVEASLTAATDSPEAERFVRQRDAVREQARVSRRTKRDEEKRWLAEEGARVEALTGACEALDAPIFRVKGKQVAGDLSLAVASLGLPIDSDPALSLMKLVGGPVRVKKIDDGKFMYLLAEGALRVHVKREVVIAVDIGIRPSEKYPNARYARAGALVRGMDPFTRDAILELLGDPGGRTEVRNPWGGEGESAPEFYEEYRINRKRVLMYWRVEDEAPRLIAVGKRW